MFDHRAALTEYARGYGLGVTPAAGVLKITDGKGELTATFDDRDWLGKLDGANVAVPPAKKLAAKKPAKVVAKDGSAGTSTVEPGPSRKAHTARTSELSTCASGMYSCRISVPRVALSVAAICAGVFTSLARSIRCPA